MLRQRLLRCCSPAAAFVLVSARIGLSGRHPGLQLYRILCSAVFTCIHSSAPAKGSRDWGRASCTRGGRLRSSTPVACLLQRHPQVTLLRSAVSTCMCLGTIADHACPFRLLLEACDGLDVVGASRCDSSRPRANQARVRPWKFAQGLSPPAR